MEGTETEMESCVRTLRRMIAQEQIQLEKGWEGEMCRRCFDRSGDVLTKNEVPIRKDADSRR